MPLKDQNREQDVLIVGVTGRRHIVKESLDAVEIATRKALRAICASIPAGTRVLLASGLAVGADSIAARACVEESAADETFPMRLRAVLPMSLVKYRDDFKGDELQDFETLLANAKEIVELPEAKDFDRIAQYSKLRDYLVERADILLAFWSGDESEVKPGERSTSSSRRDAFFSRKEGARSFRSPRRNSSASERRTERSATSPKKASTRGGSSLRDSVARNRRCALKRS